MKFCITVLAIVLLSINMDHSTKAKPKIYLIETEDKDVSKNAEDEEEVTKEKCPTCLDVSTIHCSCPDGTNFTDPDANSCPGEVVPTACSCSFGGSTYTPSIDKCGIKGGEDYFFGSLDGIINGINIVGKIINFAGAFIDKFKPQQPQPQGYPMNQPPPPQGYHPNVPPPPPRYPQSPYPKSGCSTGTEFKGNCYELVETYTEWHVASEDCSDRGGVLASILNQDVNSFLAKLGGARTWIGGSDKQKEGVWVWPNGDRITYTNWNPSQPDDSSVGGEDCLEINSHKNPNGKWNDYPCSYKFGYICQFPMTILK